LQCFRQIKIFQKKAAVDIKHEVAHLVLKHEVDRIVLHILEGAARTEKDFRNLIQEWDRIDHNRELRERSYEDSWDSSILDKTMEEFDTGAVIPTPIDHAWWRQLQSGNYIDTIFDCPHEVAELTSHKKVFQALETLKPEQKEVLYYRAIRQWSPQQLAAYRGQTDRNIRQVYATLIAKLRRKIGVQDD